MFRRDGAGRLVDSPVVSDVRGRLDVADRVPPCVGGRYPDLQNERRRDTRPSVIATHLWGHHFSPRPTLRSSPTRWPARTARRSRTCATAASCGSVDAKGGGNPARHQRVRNRPRLDEDTVLAGWTAPSASFDRPQDFSRKPDHDGHVVGRLLRLPDWTVPDRVDFHVDRVRSVERQHRNQEWRSYAATTQLERRREPPKASGWQSS